MAGLYLIHSDFRNRLPLCPVSRVEQIVRFCEALLAQEGRNHLCRERKKKVMQFSRIGIQNQLRELGAQHGFGFAIQENLRNINLWIRIRPDQNGCMMWFPLGRAIEVLELLPDWIDKLRQERDANDGREGTLWRRLEGRYYVVNELDLKGEEWELVRKMQGLEVRCRTCPHPDMEWIDPPAYVPQPDGCPLPLSFVNISAREHDGAQNS